MTSKQKLKLPSEALAKHHRVHQKVRLGVQRHEPPTVQDPTVVRGVHGKGKTVDLDGEDVGALVEKRKWYSALLTVGAARRSYKYEGRNSHPGRYVQIEALAVVKNQEMKTQTTSPHSTLEP